MNVHGATSPSSIAWQLSPSPLTGGYCQTARRRDRGCNRLMKSPLLYVCSKYSENKFRWPFLSRVVKVLTLFCSLN